MFQSENKYTNGKAIARVRPPIIDMSVDILF